MEPVGLTRVQGKGPAIVHRCLVCGARRRNRVATDTVDPDEIAALAALAPA